jgi:TRAP transporter TAXI family solute receptor
VIRRRALLGGFAALTVSGCVGREPRHRTVRIATGSPTAVYYAIGSALARVITQDLPGTDASVLVTAASAENLQLIASGRAEVAFSQSDVLVSRGLPASSILALARVYDDLLHLVVRAGSPVKTLEDLRGKRVSVGAQGSGTVVTVRRLLTVAKMGGLDERQLGLDDSTAALTSGEIDAFFFSGGLPVTGIRRLSVQVGDASAKGVQRRVRRA